MLEDVDGNDTIEGPGRKIELCLDIAVKRGEPRVARSKPLRPVFAVLQHDVLLCAQILPGRVLAETRADLQRSRSRPRGFLELLRGEAVIELLDEPEAIRKNLVPEAHPLFTGDNLLGAENRDLFRPIHGRTGATATPRRV